MMKYFKILLFIITFLLAIFLGGFMIVTFSFQTFLKIFIIALSLILTFQGAITLIWMLYAWENPKKAEKRKSPREFVVPSLSFTAIVAMRNEKKVAKDTISAINAIDYPDELKEIIVVCRHDDIDTIEEVKNTLREIGKENISLLIIGDEYPINKPVSLNKGLGYATGEIIAIFDAEDEPHRDIYKIVNTVFLKSKVDVVQSGVQLMNYNSHWFSALNVMEYFLWFKSGLHFFTDIGKVAFLGGNTVFFKKMHLNLIGGWDNNSLTEDADIGIRLTELGAKTKIIYDEIHSTQEETPVTVEDFIKQRTRWNHGFIQIIFKGNWFKLTSVRQKIICFYVLFAPFFPILMLIYIPVGLLFGIVGSSSVVLAMLTYVPFYILVTILMVQIFGLYEFTKAYGLKYHWYLPFKVALAYIPYTFLLAIASVRASYKYIFSESAWEKTSHLNAHRKAYEVNENI